MEIAVRHAWILGAACALAAGSVALGQEDNPWTPVLVSEDLPVDVDSGFVGNGGRHEATIFSAEVSAPGAPWVRLRFDEAMLADGAYLAITSHLDGAVQYLFAEHIVQWRNTSAYFNGDAVTVDLVAPANSGDNRLVMTSIIAGIDGNAESICGPTDDRLPSEDPRGGRLLPIGCSGWIINDCKKCLLTAGHCQGGSDVIEFNVPFSNGNGSLNHPPPEDQYAVDVDSLQGNGGQGVGNDWAYFGCFPNPNTGLTPYEAQGDAYQLAPEQPPVMGQDIRITGYGTTGGGVPPEWNQIQKTHVGPFVTSSGSLVQYQTDTTGGNSGSPVIDESTGMAIGIHTHAGCDFGGGANQGTGISHPGLQDALANPKGLCECDGLAFSFPDGLPVFISPEGGTTVVVEVGPTEDAEPQPGTGMLHYDLGAGFVAVEMSEISENVYEAVFPAVPCTETIDFYFSAEKTDGELSNFPEKAPTDLLSATSATGTVTVVAFDLETDVDWTVGADDDDATAGIWVRDNPNGTTAQPENDHTEGGTDCFFTGQGSVGGNAGEADVDNGKTTLTTGLIDLSGVEAADLQYCRWYWGGGPNNQGDSFIVEVSDDAGQTWTGLETLLPGGDESQGGWFLTSHRITDVIDATDSVQIRFIANDYGNGSIIEAAIDELSIIALQCTSCPADFDGDGSLTILDFVAFQSAFVAGDDAADFNGDGSLSILDFVAFQTAFVAGCP